MARNLKPGRGIDLTEVHPEVADRLTEHAYKDAAQGTYLRLWDQHPDPVKRFLEERTAAYGRSRLQDMFLALNSALDLPEDTEFDFDEWELGDRTFAKAEKRRIPFTWFLRLRKLGIGKKIGGMLDVFRRLWRRIFGKVEDDAQGRALQAWVAGHQWIKQPKQVAKITSRTKIFAAPEVGLPTETIDIDTRNMLEWAKVHAAENVQAWSNTARSRLRKLLIQAAEQRWPARKLQRQLFERFFELNRDFRRLALSETNESYNQGWIAGRMGKRVRRIEMVDACAFCRKIHGEVFTVVSPTKEPKDGWKEVWPGKNQIGRSRSPQKRLPNGKMVDRPMEELWWPAAGTQHPHCRGSWEPEGHVE